MWTDNKKAISEVNQILKQMNESSLNKIPKKLLEEIEKNANINVDYIKPDIALEELKLEEETKEMLAVISYQYFCDEEERKIWDKELRENERKYQRKLREKYNPNVLFQTSKMNEKEDEREEKTLIEVKETFFQKIWKQIKKFLNRR